MPFHPVSTVVSDPSQLPEWVSTGEKAAAQMLTPIAEQFSLNPRHAEQLSFSGAGITADVSKQQCNADLLQDLIALAQKCELAQAINQLNAGAAWNNTEQRAACHSRLRLPSEKQADTAVAAMHQHIRTIAENIRAQSSNNTANITHIINIGIGGSDLGPQLVSEALAPWHKAQMKIVFVSNIDPHEINGALAQCPVENTVVIMSSKSFGTEETQENAKVARAWLASALGADVAANRFFAATSKPEKAESLGILPENTIAFPEWVGGRYSLWSAIGLPIAIAYGPEIFAQLLAGGHAMDTHFADQPFEQNLPVIMGLIDFMQRSFQGQASLAILPYSSSLALLPAYLQQLYMESNGKSLRQDGSPLSYPTGGIIWGSKGTNGQHSFHQLLHQGSDSIATEFLLPLESPYPEQDHQHRALVAHCISQSLVLMKGQSIEDIKTQLINEGLTPDDASELAKHKVMPGNRPSTTLYFKRNDAKTLGALIALYEHRVFVASVLWGINAFDQWGVELGKKMSTGLQESMKESAIPEGIDGSSAALLKAYYNASVGIKSAKRKPATAKI